MDVLYKIKVYVHIVGYLFYTSMVLNIAKILIDVKSQETNSRLIKSFNKHFCELNASNFILQVLFFTKLRDSKCMLYIVYQRVYSKSSGQSTRHFKFVHLKVKYYAKLLEDIWTLDTPAPVNVYLSIKTNLFCGEIF